VTGATTIDLTENFNYEDICITIHCTSNFSLSFTHETDYREEPDHAPIFIVEPTTNQPTFIVHPKFTRRK
jgi:hypothetical protein